MSAAAAPKILAPRAKCLGNLLSRLVGRLAKEAHQCGVYFFRVCPRDAVWAVLHDELARASDELGGAESRSGDGKDAVGISVNHKRGLSLPIIPSESSKAAARRKRRIQTDISVCDVV